jgi:hypothetical protein
VSRWLRPLALVAVPLVLFGLAPAARADATVVPLLHCVTYDPGANEVTAEFGYYNPNATSVTVPLGSNNIFLQIPIFRTGQPTTFLPGVHLQVFAVTFDPSHTPEQTWYLQGTTVTATNDPNLYCNAPTLDDASVTMPATLTTTTGADAQLTATVTDPKAATGTTGTLVYTLPAGLDLGTLPSGSACVAGTGQVSCPISAGSDQTVPVHSATPGLYQVTGTYVPSQFPDPAATDNVGTTAVRVTGTPTAVTGLAGSVSATGAELAGSANPAGADTTGAFSYWPDGHPELATTVGSAAIGEGFDTVALDAVLTGLTPGTTYVYQATATNGAGTATGTQRSFSTLPAAARSAGLSVTAGAPTTATVGDAVTQTFTVAEAGSTDATGVQLLVHLADGLTSVSAVPGAGACAVAGTPAVVTCDLGTVPAGSSVPVTVTATAAKAGTLLALGSVAGNEPDPSAADNVATTSVTAGAASAPARGADLSATVTGPGTSRGPITYTVTVRNAGPKWAGDLHLALSTAYGRVTWVNSRGHHCWAGSAPGCVLGGLRPGGVVRVTVKMSPRHVGPVTLTASVHSGSADPDPADNQSSWTVIAKG